MLAINTGKQAPPPRGAAASSSATLGEKPIKMGLILFAQLQLRGNNLLMPIISNPPETRALVLMREALKLLDRDGLSVAACHLSLAIEVAQEAEAARPSAFRVRQRMVP
jgi:hypothetical protein